MPTYGNFWYIQSFLQVDVLNFDSYRTNGRIALDIDRKKTENERMRNDQIVFGYPDFEVRGSP